MKHKSTARLCSIAAALMLCINAAGIPFSGALFRSVPVHAEAVSDEPVTMCVRLEGGALPGLTTDALTDAEHAEMIRFREESQDAVFAEILKLYPDTYIRYRYTVLLNGFSCVIPESLADAVRSISGVTDVSKCSEIKLTPCMATAAELGEIPQFRQETGCTGEGQVICIMDSELDTTHPMFAALPDNIQTKLKKEDVQKIAQTVGFHVNADPDKLYLSSKIPFAADYIADDPYAVRNTNQNYYHGTHVSGIAAGNAVTDAAGNQISGIAKDAQIVFMAMEKYLIPDETTGLDMTKWQEQTTMMLTDATVAMLEDAAKLRADVVNMSYGTTWILPDDEHVLTNAINAAADAGITVCISAGNDGEESLAAAADAPDHSTMNTLISEGSKALAVASADNAAAEKCGVLLHGSTKILATGYIESNNSTNVLYLNDRLREGNYNYVYCGRGEQGSIAGNDVRGKIVLVDRGNRFTDTGNYAAQAGAAGVIVCNNEERLSGLMVNESGLPMTMISKSDGELLKNASDRQITVKKEYENVKSGSGVSSYSSWGMLPSLELRPDIMGIGGNVISAAYNQQYASMSGTSMSSPYLAGCTAVLNQYLTKSGCTLTGAERQQRIRNLLMTGAVPYESNGIYTSPRMQGAGLVSLNNSIHTSVILTGAEGESKISLRDNLGTAFTFPVTVTNFGNADVSFASATLALSTDRAETGRDGAAYLSGRQKLSCEADCSALQTIAAGETKTVTLSVRLDSAETQKIEQTFKNGFYIEGYLLLEGAANNADISIPLSGFSGDYSKITLVSQQGGCLNLGQNAAVSARYSMLEQAELAKSVVNGMLNDNDREFIDLEYGNLDALLTKNPDREAMQIRQKYNSQEYDQAYMRTQWFLQQIAAKMAGEMNHDRMTYLSPNGDNIADRIAVGFRSPYSVSVRGTEIRDAAGNLIDLPQSTRFAGKSDAFTSFVSGAALNTLKEGEYTAEISVVRDSDGSTGAVVQKVSVPFTVDRTPPKVRSELTVQNGRKILKLTATDPVLDGFVIAGKGRGGEAGSYNPANAPTYGMTALYYLMGGSQGANVAVLTDSDTQQNVSGGKPLNRLLRADETAYKWLKQFNFVDFVKAKPDQNGSYTLSYDVTDFTAYNISTVDRAYNITDLSENASDPANPAPKENPLKEGIYRSDAMLLEVKEDTLHVVPFSNPKHAADYEYIYEYVYQDKQDIMYLHCSGADGKHETFRIRTDQSGNLVMTGDFDALLGDASGITEQTLIRTDLRSTDNYIAIGAEEAKEIFTDPYMLDQTKGKTPENVKVSIGIVQAHPVAEYVYSYGDGTGPYTVKVDLVTAEATLPDGSTCKAEAYTPQAKALAGDVNLSGTTDVSDAVLLARFVAEDSTANITAQGRANADCNQNGMPDSDDVILILQYIVHIIEKL
ncbi:MAG: S8 family serine peptidase [Oscillospiraceae bacterium]|nr:S8 family serine peptidase [Oscillospiraceae bacterium]